MPKYLVTTVIRLVVKAEDEDSAIREAEDIIKNDSSFMMMESNMHVVRVHKSIGLSEKHK